MKLSLTTNDKQRLGRFAKSFNLKHNFVIKTVTGTENKQQVT